MNSGNKLRVDVGSRKSIDMDDDLNSMSPMKRMSEYKEVDQMEHY